MFKKVIRNSVGEKENLKEIIEEFEKFVKRAVWKEAEKNLFNFEIWRIQRQGGFHSFVEKIFRWKNTVIIFFGLENGSKYNHTYEIRCGSGYRPDTYNYIVLEEERKNLNIYINIVDWTWGQKGLASEIETNFSSFVDLYKIIMNIQQDAIWPQFETIPEEIKESLWFFWYGGQRIEKFKEVKMSNLNDADLDLDDVDLNSYELICPNKYFLFHKKKGGNIAFKKVKAEPVKISGLSDFDFFICKERKKGREKYVLVEGITGLRASKHCARKKDTINDFKKKLDSSVSGFEQILKERLRLQNIVISPRYKKRVEMERVHEDEMPITEKSNISG